ncbi:MAG: hypothetical protein M3P48_02150, partial [Actinomycetota bacterium]|nr:hypothetical protein [Actinomycetota bacterium]
DPEQVTGYAVALPDPAGHPRVWFGGGKLAPDLTLPALERRFTSHAHYAVDAGGQEGLARGRQRTTCGRTVEGDGARHRARLGDPQQPSAGAQFRAWKRASLAAAHATEHITSHARTDPAAAADAAWAAADLLHVAAHVVDGPAGGQLTGAAEAYERAARIQYRHRPPPTYAGYRIRKASALLLDTALTAGVRRSNPQLAVLLTQLAHLARTVSELRETQRRLHQAESARAAAGRVLLAAAAAPVDVQPGTATTSTQRNRRGSYGTQRLPINPSRGVPSAASTAAAWRPPSSGPPGTVRPRSRSR